MVKKLTKAQQKTLLNALPAHRKDAVKTHCQMCQMKGEGIGDILKSIGRVLGPIVKEVGPVALKEFVIPFLKKKIEGGGLSLPGGALRLAGQRGRGRPRKVGRPKGS